MDKELCFSVRKSCLSSILSFSPIFHTKTSSSSLKGHCGVRTAPLVVAMASKSVFRLPIASTKAWPSLQSSSRRTFVTLLSTQLLHSQRAVPRRLPTRNALQQSFRRSYADSAPVPIKKKAGFFRWTWRLTKLGAVAGLGWLFYDIYLLRTPDEQAEPDPSKKTLVILGTLGRYIYLSVALLTMARYRMGFSLAAQETRY